MHFLISGLTGYIRIEISKILLTLLLFFAFSNKAMASAWVVDRGRNQLILQNFNLHGNLNGNRYNGWDDKIYLNTTAISGYFEHGVLNSTSIGANFYLANKRVDDRVFFENQDRTRLDVLEFFVKQNILKKSGFVISSQTSIGVPSYKNYQLHHTQGYYKSGWSFENRLMLGIGSENNNFVEGILGGSGSFINLEIGYRINSSGSSPNNLIDSKYNEIRSQIEFGTSVKNEYLKMLMVQIFRTNKLYKVLDENALIFDNGYRYNDLTNIVFSGLFDTGNNSLFQFGLFYEIKDRFFGQSQEGNRAKGLILGLWF